MRTTAPPMNPKSSGLRYKWPAHAAACIGAKGARKHTMAITKFLFMVIHPPGGLQCRDS